MPDGEQRDVGRDVSHPVKEEDHAEEEQKMVVTGHHVLGAEIEERKEVHAGDLLDVAFVAKRHGMGERRLDPGERERGDEQEHGGAARTKPPPARRGR